MNAFYVRASLSVHCEDTKKPEMVYTSSKILCMILHGNDFMHVLEHHNDAGMPGHERRLVPSDDVIIFL